MGLVTNLETLRVFGWKVRPTAGSRIVVHPWDALEWRKWEQPIWKFSAHSAWHSHSEEDYIPATEGDCCGDAWSIHHMQEEEGPQSFSFAGTHFLFGPVPTRLLREPRGGQHFSPTHPTAPFPICVFPCPVCDPRMAFRPETHPFFCPTACCACKALQGILWSPRDAFGFAPTLFDAEGSIFAPPPVRFYPPSSPPPGGGRHIIA